MLIYFALILHECLLNQMMQYFSNFIFKSVKEETHLFVTNNLLFPCVINPKTVLRKQLLLVYVYHSLIISRDLNFKNHMNKPVHSWDIICETLMRNKFYYQIKYISAKFIFHRILQKLKLAKKGKTQQSLSGR